MEIRLTEVSTLSHKSVGTQAKQLCINYSATANIQKNSSMILLLKNLRSIVKIIQCIKTHGIKGFEEFEKI